jgi:hypothetical protein
MRKLSDLVVLILFSLLLSVTLSSRAAYAGDDVGSPSDIGYPAHYFVFQYRSDGTIYPDSYQLVELSSPMQSLSEAQLVKDLNQPDRNQLQVVVLLEDEKGQTVFRDVVSFSLWLRGEFHGTTPEQGIDGHLIPQKSTAFVIRLPVLEASTLTLKDSDSNTLAVYNMADIINQTPRFKADTIPVTVDHRILNGSPANRVDLVVLGDGYTEAQGDKFLGDAEAMLQEFFSISPLTEYNNYYNLYILGTSSTESGSDHPPYNPSCNYWDPTCCGDPSMLQDPLQGQMVDTAFDSRYCAFFIHRLLVANESKVFAAAGTAIPDWDQIILIVNDTTYGGSGSSALAVVSMDTRAVQVAQHEYGHSFVNLADEYTSPYPGYPSCSDLPGSLGPCESNVTDVTVRNDIKWLPWILDGTQIPTPNNPIYDGLVGLFEGARYQSTGMYRSGYSCIMRALGEPFCQVPSQSYVLKMYAGGWGVPFEGIRLIEPGSTIPVSQTLSLTHPAIQVFSADILSPVGGPPVEITWLDNGSPILGETTGIITYTTSADSPGLHEITLQVKDITPLVNPLMEEGTLKHAYTWDVDVIVPLTLTMGASPIVIFADGTSTSTITATVTIANEPLAGAVVNFATSLGSVSPITATTDVSGIAMVTLISGNEIGTATVMATVGSTSNSVEVEFISLPKMFLPFVGKD